MSQTDFAITDSWDKVSHKIKKGRPYPIGAKKTFCLNNGQLVEAVLLDYRNDHAIFGFSAIIAPTLSVENFSNNGYGKLIKTTDLLFLPSASEVFGELVRKTLPLNEGQLFAYFSDWEQRVRGYYGKPGGRRWLTRTRTTRANGAFCVVKGNGQISSAQPCRTVGICPCFVV